MTGVWPQAQPSLDYCYRWGRGRGNYLRGCDSQGEADCLLETHAAILGVGGINFAVFPNQFSK